MKNKILKIVNAKHRESDGKCGTYLHEFANLLGQSMAEVNEIFSEMYNDEEIDIRIGINGYMIFKLKKT
ncbi:hypothetical protein FK004_12690 [Flavobacterium kingsejongi]|uniref:Uncharacterized protein n=1 Tax=Flavobacterium kingsejongi TaxID=1678728 RepID=A0A2S1LQI5_9FLAO|nr:hypothetical protein FK004_12690 [Flavobacterium kingsejongi]